MKPTPRRGTPKQLRLKLDEFEDFLSQKRIPICLAPPYHIVPCDCADTNCHGWRFMPDDEGLDAAEEQLPAPLRRELRVVPNEHEFSGGLRPVSL